MFSVGSNYHLSCLQKAHYAIKRKTVCLDSHSLCSIRWDHISQRALVLWRFYTFCVGQEIMVLLGELFDCFPTQFS